MTSKQRFHETMAYGNPDRVPYFEEGIREDVLQEWYNQGMDPKLKLSQIFQTDHFEEIAPEMDPHPEFWPERSADLKKYEKRLNANDPKRLLDNWKILRQKKDLSDQVNLLRIHRGFFLTMGIYKWHRFERILSLIYEDPEFIQAYMKIQGEFATRMLQRLLKDIKIDAAIFSEPIGGNEGPLISPQMYESFVLDNYLTLLDLLRANGIHTIIFRTYANARIYIPSILKYGINCLWACETNVEEMDYRDIRQEFGRDLRLIGGIDLDVLRSGKEAIRREVMEKVPPLIADGGYVPMADGRVRKDISFENYAYYRRLLEEVTTS